MENISSMPCFYGAIVLIFPASVPVATVEQILLSRISCKQYEDCVEAVLVEVKNYYSYDVDDLLTCLFAKCNLEEIHHISLEHHATILIDISFHHYDTFPSLAFIGTNMDTIHKLGACISIDPY